LGAGVGKIAEIFGCSIKEAAEARSQYTRRYSGLAYLKEERIPKDVERGYFEGLDGRWVACDSDHLMLSGYLQNGEAVIMKHATVRWMELLDKANINYSLCNFVHDEWQLKVKGKWLDALMAGKYMVQALRETGKKLNLNCPMDGNIKIGKNWCDTH
jgi:DNA polymerase-1